MSAEFDPAPGDKFWLDQRKARRQAEFERLHKALSKAWSIGEALKVEISYPDRLSSVERFGEADDKTFDIPNAPPPPPVVDDQ